MTNTQHTPGPWFLTPEGYGVYKGDNCRGLGDRGDMVCTLPGYGSDAATRIANARLIAAAPDLLASLERLVTLMNIVGDEPFRNGVTDSTGSMDEGIVIASKWLHEARAAIAKATGQ